MKCLNCGEKTSAARTTSTADGGVRRRRDCPKCDLRMQTLETVRTVDLSQMESENRAAFRRLIGDGMLATNVRVNRR